MQDSRISKIPKSVFIGLSICLIGFVVGLILLFKSYRLSLLNMDKSVVVLSLDAILERNLEFIKLAPRLGYYSGHISWETQYNQAYNHIIVESRRTWEYLLSLDTETINKVTNNQETFKSFLSMLESLKAIDFEIFKLIRLEKKQEAFALLSSLEREKLIYKIENNHQILDQDFNLIIDLKKSNHDKYIYGVGSIFGFMFMVFLIGIFYGYKGISDWLLTFVKEKKGLLSILEQNKMQQLKQQKMVELGVIAAEIGHEINNPLSIAHSGLEFLENKFNKILIVNEASEEVEKLKTYFDKIKKNHERIKKIIRGLKNFSRDGDSDPFEAVSTHDLWSSLSELVMSRLKKENVNLEVKGLTELKQIECRPIQIEQVIANLILNANDAVKGSVNPWVQLSVEDQGSTLLFRVTDSGSGISKDDVEKIFNAFYTTKSNTGGTGLGLAISVKIIESHNGKIWYNFDCKNTQFCFELPKKQNQELLKVS